MKIPEWQFDERDHPGSDFDSEAEVYDQYMGKLRNVQGEIREILGLLDLKPDEVVLEVGTGTGEFALAAAGCCSKVLALDISAPMLRYAERKARARGVENVEFLQGGFLTYEHKGPKVDAVVTQLALHHLPDFWKQIALLKIADMLRAGGKLCLWDVVYSFDPKDYERFFEGFISELRSARGESNIDHIVAHIKNEYSTLSWIMEGMIQKAGFRIDRADYKRGFFAIYQCTKESAAPL